MKYFSRKEFECKCGCGFDTVDFELIEILEDVREHFNSPVVITSGNRCAEHNESVGGSMNSQHLKGRASDFVVQLVHEDKVSAYLESKYPHQYGIGKYDGRTHVDSRIKKARWDKRSK